MKSFFPLLLQVSNITIGLFALGIELWTSFIIFTYHGLFWGIFSFFLPIVSQIYALLLGWKSCGQFLNGYSIIILSFAIGAPILRCFLVSLIKKETYHA